MKIEKNTISGLKELAKLVGLTFLLSACQLDESGTPPTENPVQVQLAVNASQLSGVSFKEMAADVDNQISSLYILQFYADGNEWGNLARVCPGIVQGAIQKAAGNRMYTASLIQSMGPEDKYKLAILANLPNYNFLAALEGKPLSTVRSACLSQVSNAHLAFDQFHPFPMFGLIKGGESMEVVRDATYDKIELVRAVARVDVGVGPYDGPSSSWKKGTIPFDLDEVQLWKVGLQYSYFPLPATHSVDKATGKVTVLAPSYTPAVTGTYTFGPQFIQDKTYCAGAIYLPEGYVWTRGSETEYDDLRATRLAVIVGGYYKGSTAKTYYRMDFIDGSKQINPMRNNVYQFNITDIKRAGFSSAEEAYNSGKDVPQNLSFTTSITPWIPGGSFDLPAQKNPHSLDLGGQNGKITTYEGTTIQPKSGNWTGQNSGLNSPVQVNYNSFYGENVFTALPTRALAYPNGDIYPTVRQFATVEGVFPSLTVAADDIYDIYGVSQVNWKDEVNQVDRFTAFDLCRDYMGEGYTNWRLPRASELLLMYLNRASLEKQRGFTKFTGAYWSGSEFGDLISNGTSKVWVVDFDGTTHVFGSEKVSANLSGRRRIRCVRQN